jgi:phage terminase large subunit
MNQKVNEVYRPLFEQKARYFIIMGGRGGGRSTVASQYANARITSSDYFRCAIMRYILGDIRNSIYREILDRAEENQIIESLDIDDGIMKIEYGSNTINAVGFRKSSSDQKSKLKSLASYNAVIIEEADEIPEEDFMQLDDSLRTVKGDIKIILLLNPPPKTHWIVKRWMRLFPSEQPGFYDFELRPEIQNSILIKSNYQDNIKNIAPASIAQYEEYQYTKPAHYWNMVKGYIPETVVGKIYNNWHIIESIPHEARLERYGVDFGYTNDPTAIVALYYYNGGYIVDEIVYKKGMSNKEIADTLNTLSNGLVIADSAEPKSIDEIRSYGVNILPAVKGKGSVNQGIQYVQDQKISITRNSKHIQDEYENYAWMKNKDGESLNIPQGGKDNAMDAIRYAFESLRPKDEDDMFPQEDLFDDDTGLYI